MANNSELKDHPDFVEIEVIPKDNGIYVRLGAKGKVLNVTDAAFLRDALYVLLDDIELEGTDEQTT